MFCSKEFKIVSNLRFISKTNFMLGSVEHEKSFITSGYGLDQLAHWRNLIKTLNDHFIVQNLRKIWIIVIYWGWATRRHWKNYLL